ncbi:MAG: hypothetical protein HY692_10005, partial [Cyanobacteria bacterium NC_groundwater_1444_Ag_S-0.65um_54_12]|nr:hypothetical protein [Cyanobacteria bacterium NC_groundwater_1444_Ag_S-0.65um_54_12]
MLLCALAIICIIPAAHAEITGSLLSQSPIPTRITGKLFLRSDRPVAGITLLETELALVREQLVLQTAFVEVGEQNWQVRLGRFRAPLGLANVTVSEDSSLASLPLVIETLLGGALMVPGGQIIMNGGDFTGILGLADGSHPFFAGGQLGLLRSAWSFAWPIGLAIQLGTSTVTNQVTGLIGGDALLAWDITPQIHSKLSAEFVGAWRPLATGTSWRSGAYGQFSLQLAGHVVA